MKKSLLCFTLLLALLLALSPGAAALETEPYYVSFSGQVQEIDPYYNMDGSESGKLFVLTKNDTGQLMNFVVDEKTVMLTENELKAGAAVTGYYLGNRPAIMIYPPQMHAEALAVYLPEGQNLKVALFDAEVVSDDGQLKLNIGADTKIELKDGAAAPVDTVLANRGLAVFYTISTRSIPAQTTPQRIVILDEAKEEQSTPPPEESVVDGMPVSVENVLLVGAPPVYIHNSGAVMIPLRAVAEALGYEVSWNSGIVSLNGEAALAIGQSTYTFDDMPIKLVTAAELHQGNTYVPLNFFREVLGLNNAYVLEKQVFIDNGEKME